MPSQTDDLALLQGTLDLLVLKTLLWGPQHGYAIARWIRETSRDELQVEDRALYLALHRLEDRELVASEWGLSDTKRRAKYYRLTSAGRRHLATRTERWERYSVAVSRIVAAKAWSSS